MQELNKLFCTYEQSKELQKLGYNTFEEYCHDIMWFNKDNKLTNNFKHANKVAILKSQAFKFFRDKFKMSYEPWSVGHKQHFFDLCSIENEFKSEEIYSVKCESPYSNQEEAESAAIDKLIEICKKK